MNLGNMLVVSASLNPQKTALIVDNKAISYRELDLSTTRLAWRLIREGCQPGDRVALHWSNSAEVVKLFFACFKAALIAVPVNVRMKTPEISYVLRHSKAVLCFSEPELAPAAEKAGRDSSWLRGSYTSLTGMESRVAKDIKLPEVNCDDPAAIMYTSGTTARPKGVTHTHWTLLKTIEEACKAAPDSMQTMLVMTQMMHAPGCVLAFCPAFLRAQASFWRPPLTPLSSST
jgi:long-chain acyl-CoA synthetase